MNPTLDAALRSWPFDPWLLAALVLSAGVYLRGWFVLRRRDPSRWPVTKPLAFVGGLAALYIALASPIEPFASLLLQVHMLQHLLLMMVVPALVWLGEPLLPLVVGLPHAIRRAWLSPLLRSPSLHAISARLTHPLAALPLFVAATWLWHFPGVYDAALRWPWLHFAQHASFLAAALVFWYPVIRPYPSRPRWSPWLLLPYLLLADVQNTVLAALLTFSDRVLYAHYEQVPRLAGISALDDQATAGVLMWVPGSVALLGPLFWIGVGLMYGRSPVPRKAARRQRATPTLRPLPKLPLLQSGPRSFDLLRLPIVGRLFRWRHSRLIVQCLLAIVAGLVIYDGLRGPQVGAMNLAGVLPWVHWRGLLVLGILLAGNFFCFACPFTLPRKLAGRWLPEGRPWPRWLRSKWLAVALVAIFLWAYEAFSLWDSPWLTAWITIGYFVGAFTVDSIFRGGSFCKYVCPIGQFNFVQSLISPLEVGVRSQTACASCATHDCIRGAPAAPGCQLQLFQPQKHGNMDCTFCLDCVHACPHENVGVLAVMPAAELWSDRLPSGVGRLARRPDLAALVLLLVFGAFANAAGMVAPIIQYQDRFSQWMGQSSHLLAASLFYAIAIVIMPTVLVQIATQLSRWGGKLNTSRTELAARFAFALLPLGFAMWLAHYSFHFFTSWETIIPVAQRFAGDLGLSAFGGPMWRCACCRPATDSLLIFELLALDLGLLLSLYATWQVAAGQTTRTWLRLQAALPWAVLLAMLFVLGVWVIFQPMEMRGTLPGGGG